MSTKVYEAFERVLNDREWTNNFIAGGYGRFLFLNRNGHVFGKSPCIEPVKEKAHNDPSNKGGTHNRDYRIFY